MHEDLSPDVVVYDLPPILAQDDLAAFLPYLDGVLLIADGTKTTARHISECERILRGHTELLGVVLNKARKSEVSANAA
jgi:Mrp family chromosome partitioning ATPase